MTNWDHYCRLIKWALLTMHAKSCPRYWTCWDKNFGHACSPGALSSNCNFSLIMIKTSTKSRLINEEYPLHLSGARILFHLTVNGVVDRSHLDGFSEIATIINSLPSITSQVLVIATKLSHISCDRWNIPVS